MKAEIGKIVRYLENDKEYAAIINDSESGGVAYLTIFGRIGIVHKRIPYSETKKNGHWSWAVSAAAKPKGA